jgi:hypothetical protein
VYVSLQVITFSSDEKLGEMTMRLGRGLDYRGLDAVLYSIPNDRVASVDVLGNTELEAVAPQLLAVGTFDVDFKSVCGHLA